MLKNGVYRLKENCDLGREILMKEGQELEIVNGVLYVGGFPLQTYLQQYVIDWMIKNPNKLINDTRNF